MFIKKTFATFQSFCFYSIYLCLDDEIKQRWLPTELSKVEAKRAYRVLVAGSSKANKIKSLNQFHWCSKCCLNTFLIISWVRVCSSAISRPFKARASNQRVNLTDPLGKNVVAVNGTVLIMKSIKSLTHVSNDGTHQWAAIWRCSIAANRRLACAFTPPLRQDRPANNFGIMNNTATQTQSMYLD